MCNFNKAKFKKNRVCDENVKNKNQALITMAMTIVNNSQ